ncbi:MAG: rhodanese-like domain-containing protein [Gemmataceae bacterium]
MVPEITPREVALQLANGQPLHLIDVRQPWEDRIAPLTGSTLIPLNELPRRVGEIPRSVDAVILFCHHGIRSRSAGEYLMSLGYLSVFSMAGGIDAWSCEVDPNVPRY